jgi:hypothetical protein
MKQTFVFLTILTCATLVLSACTKNATPSTVASPAPSAEKSGVTILQGTLQVQGKTAILKSGAKTVALESYDVSFAPYDGKAVTVTGKYSGDTLFVSEIK